MQMSVYPWPAAIVLPAIIACCTLCAQPATCQLAPAPDHSLSAQELSEKGVPSIESPWSLDDYEKAMKAFPSIARKDRTQLPRYKSEKSGEMFDRLIAQETLGVFNDADVPVEKRLKQTTRIQQVFIPLFTLYIKQSRPAATFDSEILELGGFLVRAELSAARVLHEYIAAHPERAADAGSIAAFNQMRNTFAQVTTGVVDLMTDHANIRSSESVRFSQELKESLNDIFAEFTVEKQEAFRQHLRIVRDKETDPELKSAFGDLFESLPDAQ